MKKISVLIAVLFVISMFSFVMAVDPDAPGGVGGEDAEKLQDAIDVVPLDPETGGFDPEKFGIGKTKAEERIEAINLWLDENVGWMRYFFHMKPEISWLFAFNIYFILFFIVVLILNSEGIWFFLTKKSYKYLFGIALFVIFSVLKLYIGLAGILETWRIYIFDVLIPASIWLGVILFIVLILLLIFAYPAVIAIQQFIMKYLEAKKTAKQKMELAAGTEAVNKLIEEATKKR